MSEFSLEEVNKVKDWNNMTDIEKKHVPAIEAPDKVKAGEAFDVLIEVGKYMKHPNELNHWINWIGLWIDKRPVAFVNLYPTVSEPVVRFRIKIDSVGKKKIVAREFCNLHGVWQNEKEIEVV